ncbi:hypothetical protein [Solitalea lacus]|uniref:alpha-1,3-galactosidase-related protein n=1 Tax=Solitalea lacus TaxID=2911172 RepID=UPI001EDA0925|nr:hypothetical protein [Solitalea lacus]UKJ06791.1 hypothetical protein L2B55_14790 [Solitalea lacus]
MNYANKNGMKVKYLLVAIVCLCFGVKNVFSQDVIKASDFGVKSNSFENAATGIKRAINACKAKNSTVLVLPGGRIDIWPDEAEKRELYVSNCTESDTLSKVKNIAFLFENSKNITLDGNNTLVVLHGKMISFAILNSQNIKINNIRFDYERPTISELTIKSVTNNIVETEIHRDSKYVIDSGRICFIGEGWKTKSYHTILFSPERNTLHYSTFDPFLSAKAVETDPFNVKFVGDFSKAQFKPGQILTIRDPYRDNCGAFISLSKNIWLNAVKMHYMHGLGIVSQFSENIYLKKVAVAPRENSGRVIASFADCFHFSGCRGKVMIDSCFTSGSHDDPVNVHGTHLQITGIDNAGKITVRFMHHQTYGFAAFFAGDSIALVNPKSLLPLAVATVRSARLINKKEMELELNQPMPADIRTGLCIENLTWTPEVTVQNSRFERTNTRGLLITTRRKVLITNNVFYRTGMHPILIADDASSWFESGSVQDVVVRNNVFEECGYNSGSGAINIAPENHELDAINSVHRNIRIMDNIFKVSNNTVLSARSVDYLTFTGNKIIYPQPNVKGISRGATVHLTACKHVLINKNIDLQGVLQVNTSKMNINDIKADSKVDVQESR